VNEIFDTISYAKGASLIRMLNAAIGEVAFRKGLQSYLKKFSFQNTLSADLWTAFSEASGTDVTAMMCLQASSRASVVQSIRKA
jgi:aminopeptidase N